jgi:hypothetical protein
VLGERPFRVEASLRYSKVALVPDFPFVVAGEGRLGLTADSCFATPVTTYAKESLNSEIETGAVAAEHKEIISLSDDSDNTRPYRAFRPLRLSDMKRNKALRKPAPNGIGKAEGHKRLSPKKNVSFKVTSAKELRQNQIKLPHSSQQKGRIN